MEEGTNKQNDNLFMDGINNTVKITILPKVIYRFNAICNKILWHFLQKKIPKI